jgi:hypothetical protein
VSSTVIYAPDHVRIPLRHLALALVAYVIVAVVYSWPLVLNFDSHLQGATTGDTGVYVWNQWVFQREILQRHTPYFTNAIFSLQASDDPTNLSLHNYTVFQNLLALPLVQTIGVVPAFNTVALAMRVLTALLTFLLAYHVTRRVPESWLAGLVFAWSPVLVTRSMGHFSLVAAAPLAAFLLALLIAAERDRCSWRDALALGGSIAWATSADVYYGIYCLLLGGLFLVGRSVRVSLLPRETAARTPWWWHALVASLALFVLALVLTGGWRLNVGGLTFSATSLYTPVLLLTLALAARAARHLRVERIATIAQMRTALGIVLGAGLATFALLSPLLLAFGRRLVRSGLDVDQPYWRSSPAGVDLLSLLLPNPNHPLAPAVWRSWLTTSTPDTYLENVASIPLIALATMAVAWLRGWRPSRWWVLVAGAFGLLALGPFVHVAGVNTFVPGPWALLRYAPLVGLARTPARFSVVLTLASAILFASALSWIAHTWPRRRVAALAVAAGLLFLELLPAPRTLHTAAVPTIYSYVRDSPPDTRVLHLPFGIRDGTSSDGDFTAQTQYFQTSHGHQLIGGYLSRVSQRRRTALRGEPVLDALMILSENRPLSQAHLSRLVAEAPEFLRRAKVGFVVIDRTRVTPALDAVALGALRLQLVDVDGPFELYRPTVVP